MLIDKEIFSFNQIWLVDKDEQGKSELVVLYDYKVRSDVSFEKDYLAGVYRCIPKLSDFKFQEGE